MKIAIYSRKSKFTGKGESIGNQIQLCREYISAHFPETHDDEIFVYEDEGFSAKNLDRPQFRAMMQSARKSPFDCIVAQLERETIAERIRDNLRLLARTGRWLGGVTPLGYVGKKTEITNSEGKKRSAYKLKQVPAETKTVKLIYEKFLELQSMTKEKMMRLLIIRHGESAADLLDVHEGRADFELTERGHSQAVAMSEYIGEHYRISKIYHSTFKRAVQTADKRGAFLLYGRYGHSRVDNHRQHTLCRKSELSWTH